MVLMHKSSLLQKFLSKDPSNLKKLDVIGYLANLDNLFQVAPKIAQSIVREIQYQRSRLKLVASENYSSLTVQLSMGNLLTDKYAEGYPFHRFYAGCENVDQIEWEAQELAKKLFNAEYANVQPHSGSDANLLSIMAVLTLKTRSRVVEEFSKKNVNQLTEAEYNALRLELSNIVCMGLSLNSGGHLTHGGVRANVLAKLCRTVTYDVNHETGLLDYDEISDIAKKEKPSIIIAGYSAYPHRMNYAKFRQIADDVGAVLIADMAHFAGFVAAGVFSKEENPIPYADIVTSTTHKTLRGPRGGIILAKQEYAEVLNKACPCMMGGPLPHVIAAKAIAFEEALSENYRIYIRNVLENSKMLANTFLKNNINLSGGGTSNHINLIDLRSLEISGKVVEEVLASANIIVNRNALPSDVKGSWHTFGIRIGTPALTSLGMGIPEMEEIGLILVNILRNIQLESNVDGNLSKTKGRVSEELLVETRQRISILLNKFPLYPELEIDE